MAEDFAAQLLRAAAQHVLDRLQTMAADLLTPEALAAALPGAVLPADPSPVADALSGARDEIAATASALAGPITLATLQGAAQHLGLALGHLKTAAELLGKTLPDVAAVALPTVPSLSGLAAQLGLGSAPPGVTLDGSRLQYVVSASGVTVAGTGLGVEAVRMTAFADLAGDLGVGVELTGVRVEVPGSGALLGAVLGGSGAALRGDVQLGVDLQRGVTAGGVLGPIELPARLDAGIVHAKGLALTLAPGGDHPGLSLTTRLDGTLGGVLALLVDGAGIRLPFDASAVADGRSPIGAPVLVPPTGLGASLSAGPIAGGGYIAQMPVPGHPDWTRYGGAMRLRLGPVDIKAFGVLTERPDGLSLAVVMSVEFTPAIELGLAFTLNGVGGIVGLDVTADTDALQAAARSGALRLLLFPPDPVTAAPQILATLAAVFPVHPGGLVVGPMLALGWGRPISFVRLDLAVVLSLPDPTVLILGHFRVALPLPEAPLVDLNAEIYGEFSARRVLVIVSLLDSRVGFFDVSGDIGILIRFGDDADFAISAGGFHPRFTPPPELGALRRISADLSPPFGLTLRAEGYVALTPATVQFGGQVEAGYVIGPAGVRGYLGLDALIHLDPFGFMVDLRAGVSVEAFDISIASVTLALHLEGPAPWRVQGTGTVHLPWPLPDPSIDLGPYQWGPSPAPAPGTARPLDLVAAALGRPDAWGAVSAPGAVRPVVLAEIPPATGPVDSVLVDPWSLLQGSQTAVPLDTTIARVGAAHVVAGQEKIVLDDPVLGPEGAGVTGASWSVVPQRFALGQYLDLTDDQALAAPSFEDRAAGLCIDPRGAADLDLDDAVEVILKYETFFPGREQEPPARNRGPLYATYDSALTLAASSVGRSELRSFTRYAEIADPVAVRPPEHVEVRGTMDGADLAGGALRWSDAFAQFGAAAVRAQGSGSDLLVGAGGGVELVGVGALS